MGQRNYTMDAEMVLCVAGSAFTASDIPQEDSADIIRDLGVGRFEGVAVIDISAIEIDSNNEEYDLLIQGSNSATFASGIENLAQLNLGATEVRQGGAQDSVVGRYEVPFVNEQADTRYRYLRMSIVIAGTIVTGITLGAFVAAKY